jgi:hypothetical protein
MHPVKALSLPTRNLPRKSKLAMGFAVPTMGKPPDSFSALITPVCGIGEIA